MSYQPGLHILAEFNTAQTSLLQSNVPCKTLFTQLITKYGLQNVGEVYHDFPGGGFTAVVCLTESHLSIHTWPEYQLATFDVFLSNYKKDNSAKARSIYQDVLSFFDGTEIHKKEIAR
ncbi:S-adenosylmethionine decarboxylase [Mucilaginibacter daejeonensis]|uniref:S-adenosylmethionine decarboxylase family protein n=1 Tax=Mucilaginibacter daejeonensis TaxID=398049 RepID=UPI001D1775B9|nr:S-adenosylmethionine decarboxylase [Mucilaginibacter daejeonensis]UEG54855.1 S-adenosylmethionine decarboxylase [Mucilaginibacter daejeonensis]